MIGYLKLLRPNVVILTMFAVIVGLESLVYDRSAGWGSVIWGGVLSRMKLMVVMLVFPAKSVAITLNSWVCSVVIIVSGMYC